MPVSVGTLEGRIVLRDELTSALQRSSQQIKTAGTSLRALGENLRGAGSALLPFSAAITAAGVVAFKFSSDFETVMARVGVITDIGIENIGAMREEILKLAPTVGIGPKALGEALLVVASTGLKGADALSVLEQSAKASAIGLGDTKDIARAVTAAMTAYGTETLGAEEAMNKLFVAVRAGGAEANEFAGTLGRVVGIASQVGISFDDVLSSVATFTRLGVNAEEAVTALRGVMTTFLKPTKEAREQLMALGTSVDEVRTAIRERGLNVALGELVELTQGNDDAIAAIIPNVRALSGVLGTAGAQAEAYAAVTRDIQNASTEMNEAFAVVSDTLGFKWQQLWTRAQTRLIQFGDALAPQFEKMIKAIEPLFDVVEHLVQAFVKLPDPIQTAVFGMAVLFAASSPLLFGLGSFITVVGLATSAVGFLTRSIVGSTALTAANTLARSANAAAMGLQSTALKFATGEQLAFAFAAQKGSQLLLPLSGTTIATGTAATAASRSVGLLARAFGLLTGPVGLTVSALAGILTVTGTWREFIDIVRSLANILGFTMAGRLREIVRDFREFWDLVVRVTGALDKFLNLSGRFNQWTADWQALMRTISGALFVLEERLGIVKLPDIKPPTGFAAPLIPGLMETDEALAMLKSQINETKTALAELGRSQANAANFFGRLTEEQKKLRDALGGSDATKNLADLMAVWRSLSGAQHENIQVTRNVLDVYNSLRDQLAPSALPRELEELRLKTIGLAIALDQVENAAQRPVEPLSDIGDEIAFVSSGMIRMARSTQGVLEPLSGLAGFARPAALSLEELLFVIERVDRSLGTLGGSIELVKPELESMSRLEIAFGTVLEEIETDLGPAILSAFQGGGDVGGSIGAFVGESLGRNLGKFIGTAIGGTIGSVIGSVIPGIGTLLGGMLGSAVGSLFGTDPGLEEIRRVRRVVEREMADIAVSFNIEGISDLATQFFGREGAILAGSDRAKVNELLILLSGDQELARRLFIADTAEEIETVSAEIENLVERWSNFGETADRARTSVGLVSDEIRDMVRRADEAGAAIAGVTQFQVDETRRSIAGLTTFLRRTLVETTEDAASVTSSRIAEIVGVRSQEAASAMSSALLVSFAELVARGVPITEAVGEVREAVRLLEAQMLQSGLSGGAAFDRLRGVVALAGDEIAGPVIDSVNGLGQSLVGLANSGLLTQDIFGGLSGQISTTFNNLIAQGFDGTNAMLLMQPTIQTLWELQEDFGFKTDDTTQAIIDQAREQGIVGEQMRDVNERILSVLESIAVVLGAVLPGKAKIAGDAMKDSFVDARGEAEKLRKELEGIGGISVPIAFDVAGFPKIELPEFAIPDVSKFQGGTNGLRDFGPGTLAVLHGREEVRTEAQVRAANDVAMNAPTIVMPGGGGDDEGLVDAIRALAGAVTNRRVVIENALTLDGRVVSRTVREHMIEDLSVGDGLTDFQRALRMR